MTRTRLALTATSLGLAAVLGLSACGASPQPSAASAAASLDASLGDEAAALQAVGYETVLAPDPSASGEPSAAPGRKERRQERRVAARKFLRKNTLHGEMTVQGKDGARTVVVQRGTVTATDGRTLTVKSTDGFTLTWTAASDLRVVQDKKKADAAAIKTGTAIGVAGAKDGPATTARLVVIG
ncbi:hypothetical protein [Actinoplanes sp. NBRC 103695]|uniref:hypothetical protein n=1 Tax=Actinoplanes sp. NBRC 103695 TaxID=3032202 RepID=UPI0024A43588|nr:hypothetical protein [Actinoplanes sp. NBRC 103695]GLY95827.1 hypothetical protein Acsp02_30820 [Actinoplanes sp. NBRC 103695]